MMPVILHGNLYRMEINGNDMTTGEDRFDVCPVTDLTITRRPEWTDIPLEGGYSVTFRFIGDRILWTIPNGYAGNHGMAALFREREKVIRQMIGRDGQYVELRDFSMVRGNPGRVARQQMANGLRTSEERLLGFVCFNMPAQVRMVVNVSMRLYRFPFYVFIVTDYKEAVNRGLWLLGRQEAGERATESGSYAPQAGFDGGMEPKGDNRGYNPVSDKHINGRRKGAVEKGGERLSEPVPEAIALAEKGLDDILDERERHFRELMEKETRQRSIIESIEDGYYECDLSGKAVEVNDAYCRILGVSREEAVGADYRQYLDEVNAVRVFEAFNQVYRTGVPARNITYEIIRKSGGRCHIEVSASLIRDKGGDPTGFRGIIRDISERRKTEESLMMFRRFTEASGEGVGWSDLEGRIVYANDAMCRILGETDLASARGKYVTDHYDRETRKKLIHEIVPVVMKKGEWKGELLLQRKNGERVFTLNDIFLIRDEAGQPLYHAIISRDISDLKKAGQALRESEEKYRVLFDNAGDAIFVAQDGVIKFPNPQGVAMFGYSREDLAKTQFVDLIHPDDRDMVLERYKKRLKGEQLESTYSFRVFSKAGQLLWVQITNVLIEWEGRPAVLVFLSDVTDLKKMEEQLRQKYKMEAVGALAGGIAHDFNNILAGIMGYTDVIAGETPEGTIAHKNLIQVRKSVMRARGLVKHLLTFSRSAEEDYSPVNMGVIVAEALETVRALSSPSVEVIDRITAGDCLVYANPVQIHAIVLNLCNNALQAMPDGGVLEVNLRESDPDSGLGDGTAPVGFAGRYCRLVVRDTGEGMTPEVRERIFEPYFTTRPQGQGTGLGLSVVHGVVTNLGGIITVDSRPGEGSTFSIFFPLMDKSRETASTG